MGEPNVPIDEVVNDVLRAFHHPALRRGDVQIQQDMFRTVQTWVNEHPRRHDIDRLLSSESVRQGKNHILNQQNQKGGGGGHGHDAWETITQLGHGKVSGSLWEQVKTRDLNSLEGHDGNPSANYMSNSPAPPSRYSPPAQGGYGYGESASYHAQSHAGSSQGHPSHSQGHSSSYSQGYSSQPQYQQQYGGQPQPPQGYGGPGYDAPAQPQYAPHQGHGHSHGHQHQSSQWDSQHDRY